MLSKRAAPSRRSLPVRLLFLAALATPLAGCLETYCQSGSKYGTQCYSRNDIEYQETMSRGEPPPPERSVVPSPGCATFAGLRSAACTTNRQTVQGAIR